MRDLFQELDRAKWEYQSIRNNMRNLDLYFPDIVEGYFKRVRESINDNILGEYMDYTEYVKFISTTFKEYIKKINSYGEYMREEAFYTLVFIKGLETLIEKLSKINKEEYQVLFGGSIIDNVYLIYYDRGIKFNPNVSEEMQDFVRYLVNERYNKPNININRVIEDYWGLFDKRKVLC